MYQVAVAVAERGLTEVQVEYLPLFPVAPANRVKPELHLRGVREVLEAFTPAEF
jgi:hypothetical protein